MLVPREAIDLIKEFEGLRLNAYLCPAGVWTIGYGHTRTARAGMRITKDQADMLLADDITRVVSSMMRHIRVPLDNHQYGALVSFVFNVGIGAFLGSSLLRLLNENRHDLVPQQLMRWNKATIDGKRVELPGLTRRRAAEAQLWSKGNQ
jgi:lysozyme